MLFVQGQVYRRRDLHRQYGGQWQGGISTPSEHPLLFLFTGESGEQYGYRDGWSEGVFEYTGEGQHGDMEFVRGNRAILEHARNGKDLHLFQVASRGQVQYVGQMVCAGYKAREAPDVDGKVRQAIVFELLPAASTASGFVMPEDQSILGGLWLLPLPELRALTLNLPPSSNDPKVVRRNVYERSQAVRVFVLRRAGDTCEGCGAPAPFITPEGRPYLEPHHIRRRSDGGPDNPDWVAGVCPNCHRRAHHSKDSKDFNLELKKAISSKSEGLN